MAGLMGSARPVGLAALIALLGLAGCTYEDRGYGGYDYGGTGGYSGDGYPQGYGNGYGYNYNRPYYGDPYQPRYRYGNPDRYRGDYCYYHRCRWDDGEED